MKRLQFNQAWCCGVLKSMTRAAALSLGVCSRDGRPCRCGAPLSNTPQCVYVCVCVCVCAQLTDCREPFLPFSFGPPYIFHCHQIFAHLLADMLNNFHLKISRTLSLSPPPPPSPLPQLSWAAITAMVTRVLIARSSPSGSSNSYF